MNNQQIKDALQRILDKINDNGVSAWNGDLENSTEAVALEDHFGDIESSEPTTIYNGWFEDLNQLINQL
jgi:hypothetical protein